VELEQFIRPSNLKPYTGNCKAKDYRNIQEGLLVPPVPIGKRAVAFVAREIAAVQQARIQGKPEAEIKKLVLQLVEQRAAGAQ